jgi:hypothetical protein
MTKLHEDWIAFLKLLNGHRARYLVVGAHAVAAHGRPRLTADLDIWVEPTLANATRVVAAVNAFGFGTFPKERLLQPETLVFLGREPFRIDLMTSIDGVSWSAAWAHRKRGMLGTVRVSYLGARELIANKAAAGRPKDLADLALLAESGLRAPGKRGRFARKRGS